MGQVLGGTNPSRPNFSTFDTSFPDYPHDYNHADYYYNNNYHYDYPQDYHDDNAYYDDLKI